MENGTNRLTMALMACGTVIIIVILIFGNNLSIGGINFNPRTDVVQIDKPAHIVKQDVSERGIILIARPAGDFLPAYSSCAEPPPDASQDLARSISASIDGLAKVPNAGEGSIAVGAVNDLKSVSEALFQRSQGIQLLRDSMFRLCESFQNGVIESNDYSRLIESLIMTANFIIPFEQCIALGKSDSEISSDTTQLLLEQCLTSASDYNRLFLEYSLISKERAMKEIMPPSEASSLQDILPDHGVVGSALESGNVK